MSALAHALEDAGLATVALASVRGQVERSHPPRALYCEFPLGRPLGKPHDPDFQTQVIRAALALLERPEGPVLEEFPEQVGDRSHEPLACPLPPRHDESVPAAVDEARGLRPAWERARDANEGRTSLQFVDPDQIPDIVAAFVKITEGTPWKEAGIPVHPHDAMVDLRAYYEEAAGQLAGHVPEARQAETWFFEHTEAGKAAIEARRRMKDEGAGFGTWFYMAPATRQ